MDAILGRGKASRADEERALQALTTPILILPAALVLALMVVHPARGARLVQFRAGRAGAPLSLDSYRRMVASPLYGRLALKTLWTAGIAALITAAIGWCPAWALSRLSPRSRNFILLAIVIPYLTSYLLLIYSIFVVLGPGSPVMGLLRLVGLAGVEARSSIRRRRPS